jgi:dihydroneopterin aldolase/2-amino-4-hydroxy-6-hydroxymethyldihydropteridine diphosphokinase
VRLPPVLDDAGRPFDQIRLTGLTVRGFHGVFDHERRDGQDFVVDVVLHLDTRPAAATDDLTRTVHYGELAEALAAVVAGDPVDLVETLAERLAARALSDERVRAADVTVHKPYAPIPLSFSDVAVTIRRDRSEMPGGVQRAVLSLGANLGDRRAALQSALEALAASDGVRVAAVSPVVETDPVGGPEQPEYLNAVVFVDTSLDPHDLLAVCLQIEHDHGRERLVHWGARTLDIDIVAVEGVTCADDVLELPHPRAARRAFVLAPWSALDPEARLPDADGRPVPVRDLLAVAADAAGVRPATVAPLEVPA